MILWNGTAFASRDPHWFDREHSVQDSTSISWSGIAFSLIFVFNLRVVWFVLPPLRPNNQQGSGACIQIPGDSGDRWLQGSQGLSGTVTQTSCHYVNITVSQSFYYKYWTAQGLLSSPAWQWLHSRSSPWVGTTLKVTPQGWKILCHNRSSVSDQ